MAHPDREMIYLPFSGCRWATFVVLLVCHNCDFLFGHPAGKEPVCVFLFIPNTTIEELNIYIIRLKRNYTFSVRLVILEGGSFVIEEGEIQLFRRFTNLLKP